MATVTVTPGYSWSSGEIVTPAKMNLSAAPTVTAVVADGEIVTNKIADLAVSDAKLAATLNLAGKTITLPAAIALPAGAVMAFAMNSAPAGWLAANGAAVSRSVYADLFAAIGTIHGAGNGSTTFNLPNLRGIFVRGSGAQTISGVTYDKAFANKEQDALQGHFHYLNTTLATGGDTASVSREGQTSAVISSGAFRRQDADGPMSSLKTDGVNGIPREGAETRPASLALLYCIKF
jgi:microcystin-dependent protein